ncbi:hypothetical protein [Geobacter grbiciae]|uniref:hypothetical protein n=1 Tax=Geobacter grbiciae TaxID=155042 RepID=UPI001C0233D1|nr:hypothetical protein [Geobacter grbiciae]MBT1075030.1 hypothetical protein [Geobacter grbiciae]
MIRRSLLITFLLMSAVLLQASRASARLRGDIELNYVSYEAQEKGTTVTDAHTFSQRYSVLYEKSGELYSDRFGFYNGALGYEWASFDSRVYTAADSATWKPSTSAGKILFNGELVLDPAELPLKLKVYSRDMTTSTFTMDSLLTEGRSGRIFEPNIITSLNGTGTNTLTGATMVLGVKNGLTNGYNAIFRHIPMVLLDYRDERHEDSRSITPVDTRLRKLAFVSLNKRDNWFHYRTTRFDDYINPGQSYQESQVQLGTVDHTLQRRWIDLTNWLKISTDFQYTKRSASHNDAYDVNFFAMAQRKNWDARSFLSFSREREGNEIRLERNIPLYLSGAFGMDSSWNASVTRRDREVKQNRLTTTIDNNTSAMFRLESFKRSPFTLSQRYTVEDAESNGTKTLGLEALLETMSTRRFSDQFTVGGGYNIRYLGSEREGASSYLFQNARGRLGYRVNPQLTLNLDESVTAVRGNSAALADSYSITTQTNFGNSNDVFRREEQPNDYYRSVTTAGLSWLPLSRLTVSLTATEDVLVSSQATTDYLTTVNNRVDYTLDNLRLNMENRVSLRSNADGRSTDLQHTGSAQYTPNRSLDALVRYMIYKRDEKGNNSTYVDLMQRLTYSFYQLGGQQRKLLELTEEFTISQSDTISSTSTTTGRKRFLLGARYYPLRNLYLGGNVAYSLLLPRNAPEFIYNGYVGLNFRKFQFNIDYSYGKRKDDERVEKRLMASMKKSF